MLSGALSLASCGTREWSDGGERLKDKPAVKHLWDSADHVMGHYRPITWYFIQPKK